MGGTFIADSENDCRRLVDLSTPVKKVDISANDQNTGHFRLTVGDRSANTALGQGEQLNAKDRITLENVDLSDVWVAGSVAGDKLTWTSR